MPLALASVPSSDLYADYLGYLRQTGRGNVAYTRAARAFFKRWPRSPAVGGRAAEDPPGG